MWAPETYPAWKARSDEVQALNSAAAQLAYACDHRIDYVVFDKRPGHMLPGAEQLDRPAFSNRWFVVAPACATT
jgi:hypothetical protein